MDGVDYEYLIRRAFGCGRDGSTGADADIYRRMYTAHQALLDTADPTLQEPRRMVFKDAFDKARDFVLRALSVGTKTISVKDSAIEADIIVLKGLQKRLRETNYDVKDFEDIVESADDIFRKYGLEPG